MYVYPLLIDFDAPVGLNVTEVVDNSEIKVYELTWNPVATVDRDIIHYVVSFNSKEHKVLNPKVTIPLSVTAGSLNISVKAVDRCNHESKPSYAGMYVSPITHHVHLLHDCDTIYCFRICVKSGNHQKCEHQVALGSSFYCVLCCVGLASVHVLTPDPK